MKSVVLDCYTVEPSGLGVPPYMSAYVRNAFDTLVALSPDNTPSHLTIDALRACLPTATASRGSQLSDALTYSATRNRNEALKLHAEADLVIVVAGDAVPSRHLHAVRASPAEISRAMASVHGSRLLLYVPPDYSADSLRELLRRWHRQQLRELLPDGIARSTVKSLAGASAA